MTKARVFMASFGQEANSFLPGSTGRKEYDIKEPDEVIPYFEGTPGQIGGFIEASKDEGFEIIPGIAASGGASAPTTREMFEFAKDRIIQAIKDIKNLDGILLSLHGAMLVEGEDDGEGLLLKAIRNVVGPKMPIVATLDLHVNLTDRKVENTDAFFPHEYWPHTDNFERGYEAGKCLARMMRKEIWPVMRARRIPILIQTSDTTSGVGAELLEKAHKWEEKPKVINVNVQFGFPWGDVPSATLSVLAITDGDSKLAQDIVDDMARTIWERRAEFHRKYPSPEEAIKEAMEFPSGPVAIIDTADNPGGGGPGDSTFVLRALIKAGAKNVAVAGIHDPECVEQAISAGVGTKVKLSLGGKFGTVERTGGPLEILATVRTISDGKYTFKGPFMTGMQHDMGHTVVLEVDGIEIIVAEQAVYPLDAQIFRRVGLEPGEKKILALKGTVMWKAGFEPLVKKHITVDTPSYVSLNFESLDFKKIPRPVYPLDRDFEYVI